MVAKVHFITIFALAVMAALLIALTFFLYIYNSDTDEVDFLDDEKLVIDDEIESQILNPMAHGGLDDDYVSQVAMYAESSDVLVIDSECKMNPLVLKMSEEDTLVVSNQDDTDHVIAFEDQNFFAVSANATREISLTKVFGKEEGIYRYRCGDQSQEVNVGVLYVVNDKS